MVLITGLIVMISLSGASSVQDFSPFILLGVSALALGLTLLFTRRSTRLIFYGLVKSARQILPALPLLVCIAMLSTTWMVSGVVPLLIHAGVEMIDPRFFLVITCAVCAMVSVVTGSSWTTIATVGVAFAGIGAVMGYNIAWVAGAIISGAYFGDKISPLSDTTVLAASSCGLDLFKHIRFMMYTSVPAMVIALLVFSGVGFFTDINPTDNSRAIAGALEDMFNLTPWLLVIPGITIVMIALRLPSLLTLAVGSLTGLVGVFVSQPEIAAMLADKAGSAWVGAGSLLIKGTSIPTSNATLADLVDTSGIVGMLPTVFLVSCAMLFGGIMIGSGMLFTLTRNFTRMLRRPRALVGATVASGLFLNGCTGDQYLSIIIGGNIYRSTYRRHGLADEMLSRSLEDSISVTSVLIPWNSCGMTQAAVLGVATLSYLPYCIFNIMSPILSIAFAWIGFKIRHRHPAALEAEDWGQRTGAVGSPIC